MSLVGLMSQHLVRVDKRVETRGAAGSAAFTWPEGTEYRGYKRELTSIEAMDNLQRGFQTTHRVYFSSEPDVDNQDRLVVDGQTLVVQGALVHKRCGRLEYWYADAIQTEVVR